ncbi:MAG TPA: hypothetical protein VK463_06330, partial [Desulfomonilaceae bacterium]|nr:hypothetical protein [Desulfomonilaceae bacterium]
SRIFSAWNDAARASLLHFNGLSRYCLDFVVPFLRASNAFWEEEQQKLPKLSPDVNFRDYLALLRFNVQIGQAGLKSSCSQMTDYHVRQYRLFVRSLFDTLTGSAGETVDELMAEKAEVLDRLVVRYPDAIWAVGSEFGFHPESGGYVKVAETPRMELYQVLPTEKGVATRPEVKPILVAHPYVLGPGILTFLPSEKKSYVHAFANEGIPTYLRIIKNIHDNDAVQIMTGENDARDTADFCRFLKEKHGKPVTLNGFCQGGFIVLAGLLSGMLDGLVDALITCVAPIDGTRSKGLVEYLEHIAPRFRDLHYATKPTASGNEIVDGEVMSWVYKLKSIGREAPLFTYYRDICLFETMLARGIPGVGKTAAAINHWLVYGRTDLPLAITQMSFDSYTIPISAQGDLPFKLFGRTLNFDYIREKGIKFQICYAAKDDLVDPPAALAPKDFIDVELAEFPKGHAAIATSWSNPDTEYGLHKRFANGQRGPVRLQLDLDEALHISETDRKACV